MESALKTFLLYKCEHCDAYMFRTRGSTLIPGTPFVKNVIGLQNHDLNQIKKSDFAICGECGRINPTRHIFKIKNWNRYKFSYVGKI